MKANGTAKKIAIALISLMLVAVSTYSFADLLPPVNNPTGGGGLVPLVPPKPAGSASSIRLPPISTTPTGVSTSTIPLTVPQRTAKTGPEGKSIIDARYDLDLPMCPATNNLCPDINNKCANAGGGCRDMTIAVPASMTPVTAAVTNYLKCPETCRVSRTTTGWNATRNAPDSSVEAVCPAGYAQLAAYNLAPEYKTSVGTAEIQLPWPLQNAGATSYPSYFYDSGNYRCGFYAEYYIGYCQSGTSLSPPQNATPLNGTLTPMAQTNYGWISTSYDYGYTNYGADQSYTPNINGTCYKNGNCNSPDDAPVVVCTYNYTTQTWGPNGCNAYDFGWGWFCSSGTAICKGTDPWGVCNNWACPVCTASSYHWITRKIYPNICWYRGGKLIPGAGQIPTSLVCGRIKQTWK